MVEMVIVVMIIGIMTAIAAPAFVDSLLYHRVESAARRLKADLELARQTARLTSATRTVTFSGTTYTLGSGVKGLDRTTGSYAVDLAAPPFELSTVTANFNSTQTVSFDGHGTPSSGGTVVLQANGHRCTVTLHAGNGEVAIASLHNGVAVSP